MSKPLQNAAHPTRIIPLSTGKIEILNSEELDELYLCFEELEGCHSWTWFKKILVPFIEDISHRRTALAITRTRE